MARGEQNCGSDIDLVAMFDDVDYRQRLSVAHDLRKAARQACGHRVEVLVTEVATVAFSKSVGLIAHDMAERRIGEQRRDRRAPTG